MKKVKILLLVMLILYGFSNLTAQQWVDAISISQGNNPDFVIDPETGELHIVAVIDGQGVIYTKTDKLGETLESYIVPNTSNDKGLYKYGPTIAIDSDDYPHIGFREYRPTNKYDIFYTRNTASGWSEPLQIGNKVIRGYVVRMAIDGNDFVHFAHGSLDQDWPNDTGPIHYYILQNGTIQQEQHFVRRIRADERFELDVSAAGIVDLVTGDYHYKPDNPTMFYWRSPAAGDTLEYVGDIHHYDTNDGPNGSADLFVDASGNTHICYGAAIDQSIAQSNKMSIRYCRIEGGEKKYDVRVTDPEEITEGFKVPVGIASVAASDDGEKVVIAYMAGEYGPLYARLSEDGGQTWQDPINIADGWYDVWAESRNKQIIRAYRGDFYLVYPTTSGIKLKYILLTPNEPPVAALTTPDSALEGSIIDFDASGSYDSDGSIVAYLWDFQNDDTLDEQTTEPYVGFTYVDEFSGEAKLTVVDDKDDSAAVIVSINVTNVAPIANAGGTYTGDWYTPIAIHAEAEDPGVLDTLYYAWDIDEDGYFETFSQNPDTLTPAYTQGDTHWVVLRVTDGDGGVDVDSAVIVINNLPPVMTDIIDQLINEGESFTPIQLDNFVTDPDNRDSTITWSYTGATDLNIIIDENRIATITPINPLWAGTETITFTATDPGGKWDSDDVTFTLYEVNDPPVISPISGQTRLENQLFDAIHLDDYVFDPDDHDSTLVWNYFDNDYFNVYIIDGFAMVAVLDSEWAGTDTIGFKVSDPQGLSDTALVTYTINPINDPPVVTAIEDQQIYQDQKFALIYLDDHVEDPDDPDSLINWNWIGGYKLEAILLPGRLVQINRLDTAWVGTEEFTFWATDTYGQSDQCTVRFKVIQGIGVDDNSGESIPHKFALHPNYPNPFNPSTCIQYELATSATVELKIFNQLGHEVRTLIYGNHQPGSYSVVWDGRDNQGSKLSSGIYIYRIKADGFIKTRKMLLIY